VPNCLSGKVIRFGVPAVRSSLSFVDIGAAVERLCKVIGLSVKIILATAKNPAQGGSESILQEGLVYLCPPGEVSNSKEACAGQQCRFTKMWRNSPLNNQPVGRRV
jgi:hypothetical protein